MQQKPPRAKCARVSWEKTEASTKFGFTDDLEALLSNYLSGRQLEAGIDAVKILERAHSHGEGSLAYKELREALMERGHTKRTIEEALRKLKEAGIAINEGITLYRKKRHKLKRKEHKRASMAGKWRITWHTYLTDLKKLGKKAEVRYSKLRKLEKDG